VLELASASSIRLNVVKIPLISEFVRLGRTCGRVARLPAGKFMISGRGRVPAVFGGCSRESDASSQDPNSYQARHSDLRRSAVYGTRNFFVVVDTEDGRGLIRWNRLWVSGRREARTKHSPAWRRSPGRAGLAFYFN
jgi:hypothetical protein